VTRRGRILWRRMRADSVFVFSLMSRPKVEANGSAGYLSPRGTWVAVAVAVIGGLTVSWALSAAGFLAGMPVGRWQSLGGALAAVTCLYRFSCDWRSRVSRGVMLVTLVPIALAIAGVTVDDGYDGWIYHEPGVIGLAHGWNPVAQPRFDVWWAAHRTALGSPPDAPFVDGLLTTAFPKALWVLDSYALVWGLPLDSGKYVGILLIFAAGGVALRALRLAGLSARWSLVLAVVAALNPVSVMQTTTYYVDGALGSCLTVLAFSLVAFNITQSRLDLFLAICASLIACNLKFTGPVYVIIMTLPVTIWWLWRRQLQVRHLKTIGVAAVLLILCSVNPYLTNVRIGGSPVQPLNRDDLMVGQMWPEFLAKNRIEKLFISLTFTNHLNPFGAIPNPELKRVTNPFQLRSISEFEEFATSYDLRIGGFGPLFAVALALASVIALMRASDGTRDVGLALIAFGTVASILVMSVSWWARFVPQMWLVPVLASAYAIRTGSSRRMGVVIVGIMGVSVLIAVGGRIESAALTTLTYQAKLRSAGPGPLLVNAPTNKGFFLPVFGYRLQERGTYFQMSETRCANPIQLIVIQACTRSVK
jgi:hypothetical protein